MKRDTTLIKRRVNQEDINIQNTYASNFAALTYIKNILSIRFWRLTLIH